MVPSTGHNKTRIAVFISGTGSNLKSLIQFSRTTKSPISINFIFSNNSKAKGLKYAKIYRIKKKVIRREEERRYYYYIIIIIEILLLDII